MDKNLNKNRVLLVKAYFKAKGISREEFFDNVFGPMGHKNYIRTLNLWQGITTDDEFTSKMERYASNRERITTDMVAFERFNKFVKWYMDLGGAPLTPEQIEDSFTRFIIKAKTDDKN